MAREIPIQSNVDPDLFAKLKASADQNLRSMSAEIYLRLKASFGDATTTEG